MSSTLEHRPPNAPPDENPFVDGTLVERLSDIPLDRINLHPAPGTATEVDVVRFKYCEPLDGVIVMKDMNGEESGWQQILGCFIEDSLRKNRIAVLAGADGLTRRTPGRVHIPDLGIDRSPQRHPRFII